MQDEASRTQALDNATAALDLVQQVQQRFFPVEEGGLLAQLLLAPLPEWSQGGLQPGMLPLVMGYQQQVCSSEFQRVCYLITQFTGLLFGCESLHASVCLPGAQPQHVARKLPTLRFRLAQATLAVALSHRTS
jgi:hypothetical protein